MNISKAIQRIYGKLFVGGSWKVAYRERMDYNGQYSIIEAPQGKWIADPLLYEDNGQHFLFVELFDEKLDKAGIGYYQFIDGQPVFKKQIIEQPFHLSYPCIFCWNGMHYMIPESAAGKTLDLYRADHFPDEWKWDCNLIKGEKFVDTTVVERDGRLYALGYHKTEDGWGLTCFQLDMEQKKLIRITEETFSENIGRPAGYVLKEKWLRPAQDCSRFYGESVIWYQIDRLDESGIREHAVSRMTVNDLPMQGEADRVHTYSRDTVYEVVDLRYGKFDVLHGLKTLKRSIIKK